MAISIQTNIASLIAQQNLQVNNDFANRTVQRLTSGYRINSSGDDAAGLVIANTYRSGVAELSQGVRNANDGLSTLQIIDGGLNNISNILDRLKTLATESASDTLQDDAAGTKRASLDKEFQALLTEIDRQADNIGLGATGQANLKQISVYIGGGSSAANSAVTVDLSNAGVDQTSLTLNGMKVDNTTDASASLAAISNAVANLGSSQGAIGTGENDLNYAIQLAQSQITGYSAAESRLRDADMAAEAANLTKVQVLQQASIAAMAQANSAPQAVLSLLKG